MSEHDQRVSSLVKYMQENEFIVNMAAIPGYDDPILIGRHEPDAIGKNGSVIAIGEAKTEEDYNSQHSREQYEDFGKSNADKVYLHLPLNLHSEVRRILEILGVSGKYILLHYTREQQ